MSTETLVYADWEDFKEPQLVGTLRSSIAKNKEHFSFTYDDTWLLSRSQEPAKAGELREAQYNNPHL